MVRDRNNQPDAIARRPESVLVVVASRDGRALLLRRHRPAGYWQSVTGALHWDESPGEAARRELAEETGLEGDLVDCAEQHPFRIDPRFGHRYGAGVETNVEHHFELWLDAPGEVRLDGREHAEACWLPFAEAIGRASSASNRLGLQRARAALRAATPRK